MSGTGFDGLAGAGGEAQRPPVVPAGIRTVSAQSGAATMITLIRHGEAVCNVSGVCGGQLGCTGLTDLGRSQVAALRDRLMLTGELADTDAFYASILPRAMETARIIAPALVATSSDGEGPVLDLVTDCGLCELHPGEADGLNWTEFTERFGALDWAVDPDQAIAPGGESWTGFVNRVSATLDTIAHRHPGERVVVACHAGVIEASLLSKMPVVSGLTGARLQLRTLHASMTKWEVEEGRWRLIGYNDGAHEVARRLAEATMVNQQA